MQTLTRRMAGSGFRQIIMGTPLCLLLLVLRVYPVGQLLFQSVWDENGAFSLDNYARLFHTTVYVDVLLITLKISLWKTLFAVLAGFPVAYLISSLPRQRKGQLLFWVILSFWPSFMLRTFAWVVLVCTHGTLHPNFEALGNIKN